MLIDDIKNQAGVVVGKIADDLVKANPQATLVDLWAQLEGSDPDCFEDGERALEVVDNLIDELGEEFKLMDSCNNRANWGDWGNKHDIRDEITGDAGAEVGNIADELVEQDPQATLGDLWAELHGTDPSDDIEEDHLQLGLEVVGELIDELGEDFKLTDKRPPNSDS